MTQWRLKLLRVSRNVGNVICNVSTLPLHYRLHPWPGQSLWVFTHISQGLGSDPRHVSRSMSRDTLVTASQSSCHTIPVIIIHRPRNCPQCPVLPVIFYLFQATVNMSWLVNKIFFPRDNFCVFSRTDLNESASCCHGVFGRHWCLGWLWCQHVSGTMPLNIILILPSQ